MASYKVTDPNTGQTLKVTGDSPPTEQELEEIFSQYSIDPIVAQINPDAVPPTPKAEYTLGEKLTGAKEAAKTMISGGTTGAARFAGEGLMELARQIRDGNYGTMEAADLVEKAALAGGAAGTTDPSTPAGKEYVSNIGEVLQNIPPVIPVAGAPVALMQGTKSIPGSVSDIAAKVPGMVTESAIKTVDAVKKAKSAGEEIKAAIFDYQTPAKTRIAEIIKQDPEDERGAEFEVKSGSAPKNKLQEVLGTGKDKVVSDTEAIEAKKQGWDGGVIAAVKGASDIDKNAFLDMVDIAEKSKFNAKYGMTNRHTDVSGDILKRRFDIVHQANKDAGKNIDVVADKLEGQPIDVGIASKSFADSMDKIGVKITRGTDGFIRPSFKGSDIEGLPGPEGVITRVVNRIDSIENLDALEAHKLKRFIDEQVTYGKNAEGLAGRTEVALKKLRAKLNEALGDAFPEYKAVNTQYSDTIHAIDMFQDVAGRKLDLTAENADKAIGTLMRRLMGNAPSRIRLLNSIKDIDEAAKKYGGMMTGQKLITGKVKEGMDRDMVTHVLFADEIDSMFGPAARTSLQGQFDQVMKRSLSAISTRGGALDAGIDVAADVFEKARGINEENAIKSIRELLKKRVK